jgi:hypothetical protein
MQNLPDNLDKLLNSLRLSKNALGLADYDEIKFEPFDVEVLTQRPDLVDVARITIKGGVEVGGWEVCRITIYGDTTFVFGSSSCLVSKRAILGLEAYARALILIKILGIKESGT